MQSSRQKILGFVLVIAIAFAGVYYYKIYGDKLVQVASIVTEDNGAPVGEDILVLVQKLDYISIDDSILASAIFTSLKDTSVQINPEEKYRPNPFATIGGAVVTPVNTTPNPPQKTTSTPKR